MPFGRVLIVPATRGSAGAWRFLHQLKQHGTHPLAIMLSIPFAFIGAVAGHLTRLDLGQTFYPFVVGHGAFELTAIVFSGAAGLRLGYSILNPGQLSRLDSLRRAGRDVVPMLYGIVLMLIVAAFIEAFWSASATLPIAVKYAVAAVLWGMVLLYSFSGGRHESR